MTTEKENAGKLSSELMAFKLLLKDSSPEGWRLFWAIHDAAFWLSVYSQGLPSRESSDTVDLERRTNAHPPGRPDHDD